MTGISAGSFRMGDVEGDGQWDEHPVHRVEISHPFYISETEITVEQFRQFRPSYTGFESYAPYATGISWYEAMEFCRWLSKKEGRTYRLPTEAEWEYACRKGAAGLKNMQTGALEWCYDWYGPYPFEHQRDPAGREAGFARVIRGGLPDDKSLIFDHSVEYYSRPSNRASLAPAFDQFLNPADAAAQVPPSAAYDQYSPGLSGLLFDDRAMQKPLLLWRIMSLDSEKLNWFDRDDCTAEWRGYLNAPFSGTIRFDAEASTGIRLIIDGDTIIEGWGLDQARSGEAELKKGIRYPLVIQYLKDPGDDSYMRLYWSWEGSGSKLIAPDALSFNRRDDFDMKEIFEAGLDRKLREPSIGFRIVRADLPDSPGLPRVLPFSMQGVKQEVKFTDMGPDSGVPYFRKRLLLPMPPDNTEAEHTRVAGVDPYFSWHNHNPALTVCPNGDLLFAFFTATYEDEPEVAYGVTRLRRGADEWDWPGRMLDFADVNDVAPLLWNDDGRLWMFFSCLHLDASYPFQWITSEDNGATWSEVRYPDFSNRVGPHTPQPISSAFRDQEGTIYFGLDGLGPTSLLFASGDNGNTWYDTGGRTYARHSVFVPLRDGSIVAYGGKHSDLDGFMPKSITRDGGATWEHSSTPFATLGTNQRPTIIRLASGRLFFASDLQRIDGFQPPGSTDKGSFVALSEDEGKTWKVKKLIGGQQHESEMRRMAMQGNTLGYAIARQSPDGMIHLIATMTDPCLHYEFNEAWILDQGPTDESLIMESKAGSVSGIESYRETWPDGTTRLEYKAGKGDDGRFLLHGKERWFHQDGTLMYEVTYDRGRKTAVESYRDADGQLRWEWDRSGEVAVWRQWWPNGRQKGESRWMEGKCEGKAYTWDPSGKLIGEVVFKEGRILEE
jgi:hypothetical protein